MDGISSTNLFKENTEISRAQIAYRNYTPDALYAEDWPFEYIGIPTGEVFDTAEFHSSYDVSYALQAYVYSCQFVNESTIQLLGDLKQGPDYNLVSMESIKIIGVDIIEVTALRRLYTRNGYVTMRVVSQFQRFTSMT